MRTSTRRRSKLKIIKDGVEYQFERAAEGGYVATVPLYPSCASQGETLDEALRNIEDALVGCLQAAVDLKLPVPRELEPLLRLKVED
jgi:predicted RNase H-like HicB family nuclease